jgi:hypothetical protein
MDARLWWELHAPGCNSSVGLLDEFELLGYVGEESRHLLAREIEQPSQGRS